MAIVRFGGGIADARGSVGGVVLSRGYSGPIMTTRKTPCNPRSVRQSISRSRLGSSAKVWANRLTDEERAAWKNFAALNPVVNIMGDVMVISGIAMFTRLNTNIAQMGGDPITIPPASLDVTVPTSASLVLTAGEEPSMYMGVGSPDLEANERVIFFCTPCCNLGRTVAYNKFRYIGSTTSWNANVNMTFEWQQVFGACPLTSGNRVWMRAAIGNQATGAVSPWLFKTDAWADPA